MTVAGPAPVPGSSTPIAFDSARPTNDAPTIDKSASALPAEPDAIREMQARGRSWLHSNGLQQGANTPGKAPNPMAPIPSLTPSPYEKPVAPAKPPRIQTGTVDNASLPPSSDKHLKSLTGSCNKLVKIIDDCGTAFPQYKGALLAVRSLFNAILSRQQGDFCDETNLHANAENSMPFCDLDEAVHGMFAASKRLTVALSEGLGSLGDALTQEANLWAHDPKAWLAQSAMPHGGADAAVSGIITAALVPFAFLALHAGFSEMRDAKLLDKELELELKHSFEFLQSLERLSKSLKTNTPPQFLRLLDAYRKASAQRMADLKRLQKKTAKNAQIGLCSAGSGTAILGSAALGTLGKTVAIPAVATAVGAAGTLAVGPAAALFAVGLGANMVSTSTEARKHFEAAAKPLKKRLEDSSLDILRRQTEGKHDYLAFLSKKIEQRSHFFKNYARDNKKFLFGTCLYAGSALVGCGVTAAALLGAGIVLGPIGMGALLVGGTVGGLIMGSYSKQFLFGHGRTHRYENDSVGDHPELDRKFQNILDSMKILSGDAMGVEADTGLALRADIYKQASDREELRQDFLIEVAAKTDTRYHQMYSYSTDSEEVRAKRGGTPTGWSIARAAMKKKVDTVIGYSQAGWCYLSKLLHSRSHSAAKAAAGKLRQKLKQYLSAGKLQEWLHKEENHSRQIAFMLDCLNPQIENFRKMTKLQTDLYSYCNNLDALLSMDPGYAAPFEIARDALAQATFLESLAAPLARRADLLGQMEHLKTELTDYVESSEAPSRQALAQTIMQFLSVQQGKSYDAQGPRPNFGESQKAFADYTMNEAMGSYRHLRGMLIDVELQATRLAQRKIQETINPRSGA